MLIRTVIIEDEQNSLDVIKNLMARFAGDLELLGSAGNVEEASSLIEAGKPGLVFMDVRLADGTGFDVLRKLNEITFQLVFITAYDNFAFDAIKFSAIDYLLKPLGFGEFQEAVNRVRIRLLEKQRYQNIDVLLHNLFQKNDIDRRLAVATVEGYEFVELKNIMWCNSEKTYTIFHLPANQKVISSKNLGYYEKLLSSAIFCRIHNSVIINMYFVERYIKGKGGYVIMKDGTQLEVSYRRKTEFLAQLSI